MESVVPSSPLPSSLPPFLETLRDLYDQIDQLVAPLAEVHRERLSCRRGCSTCCQDNLTVFAVEAENIRFSFAELLRQETPHSVGGCAFLDDRGGCRIYAQRPYVCRTQGLPLRWVEESKEGELVERRDICPLNEAGTPVEKLPPEQCWTLGPVEEALAEAQQRMDNSGATRIALRSLFVADL